MPVDHLAMAEVAPGRPFHAAVVPLVGDGGGTQRPHDHADFHEVFLVLSGRGRQHLHGGPVPLRAGDLALVRPRDVHWFTADAGDTLRFVNVAFRSAGWYAFAELAGLAAVRALDDATDPPLVHEANLAPEFDRAVRSAAADARMLDLVMLWTAVAPVLARSVGPAADRPEWLDRACAAMADEQHLRAGLGRFAELAAVSPGHLARCVQRHLGVSAVRWVAQRRLAHAAFLLVSTSEPVGRIAQRCGFASQAYFARVFRAEHGCSPRSYRERSRRAVVPGA